MADITKDTLLQVLNDMCNTIKNATKEDYSCDNWYSGVLRREELQDYYKSVDYNTILNREDRLAIDAVKYPELYPVVREIIKGITQINNKYSNGPIDVDSEWSAGSFFAGRLALASKEEQDLLLFANHLATRDLDHEADPFGFFGVWEIFREFGYCDKTMPVLIALFSANSQHRGDHFTWDDVHEMTAYLNQGDNLNRFLKDLAVWEKKHRNIPFAEMFELLLCEALELEEDQYEEAGDLFEEILLEDRIPVKDDFASL